MAKYLTVVHSDNIPYVQLNEPKNQQASFRSFNSLEDAKKPWEHFYDRFGPPNNYETHTSTGLGIMNLRPHIIKLDDDPQIMRQYILSGPCLYGGIGFGFKADNAWVAKVYPSILKLSVLDIAHDVIWRPENNDRREMYAE